MNFRQQSTRGYDMNITISSRVEDNYLLIKASGSIVEIKEYKMLQKRYYDEIMKFGYKKIIVDESEMLLPKSLMAQDELVEFFSNEFPEEIKEWKLAAVMAEDYIIIAKYWEHQVNSNGYCGFKVFTSIEEARIYLNII